MRCLALLWTAPESWRKFDDPYLAVLPGRAPSDYHRQHCLGGRESRGCLRLGDHEGMQAKEAEKSNEINAIPELLEARYAKSFLISIDAMGCQK